MMEITHIQLPQQWHHLTMQQLENYHSIIAKGEDDFFFRISAFLVIADMEIYGMAVEQPPTDADFDTQMEWLQDALDGKHQVVLLKRKGTDVETEDEHEPMFLSISPEDLCASARHYTQWMFDEQSKLLKLPEKFINICGETFALPSVIGHDDRIVRYGQYGAMQTFMTAYWLTAEKVSNLHSFSDNEEESTPPSEADKEQEKALMAHLRQYRNGFLASLLLPTHVEEQRIDDANDPKGYHTERVRVVHPYDSSQHERICKVVDSAPAWLFRLLLHLVQSALGYYHVRFPDLISGGEKKKNTDQYVAKLSTDNTVMKYAGYSSVEAVNQEPFPVILERLDAIAKENKEYQKLKNKK